MLIDLAPADRRDIVDALALARRDELNRVDGRDEDADDQERRIDRKYDRLIARVQKLKPPRAAAGKGRDDG